MSNFFTLNSVRALSRVCVAAGSLAILTACGGWGGSKADSLVKVEEKFGSAATY